MSTLNKSQVTQAKAIIEKELGFKKSLINVLAINSGRFGAFKSVVFEVMGFSYFLEFEAGEIFISVMINEDYVPLAEATAEAEYPEYDRPVAVAEENASEA